MPERSELREKRPSVTTGTLSAPGLLPPAASAATAAPLRGSAVPGDAVHGLPSAYVGAAVGGGDGGRSVSSISGARTVPPPSLLPPPRRRTAMTQQTELTSLADDFLARMGAPGRPLAFLIAVIGL